MSSSLKYISFIFFLLLLYSAVASAAMPGQGGLQIDVTAAGVGTRALSMGGAFSAVCDDVNALFYNPAGLVQLDQGELTSMQTRLMDSVDYYYLALGIPLQQSGFAVGWIQCTVPNIPLVATTSVPLNSDITPQGRADYFANALIAAYGWQATDHLSCGVSVTGLYKDMSGISQAKGYGISSTLGLLYQPIHGLNIALVLRDAFNYQHWQTGTEEIVLPKLSLGFNLLPMKSWAISFDLDKQMSFRYYFVWHIGTEVVFFERILLRAGLDRGTFTAGFSVNINPVYFDYGYLGSDAYQWNNAHRLTLGFHF